MRGLRTVTALLPSDLPNWTFVNGHWDNHPLPADRIWSDHGGGHGIVRQYGAFSPDGHEFITLPHGIRDHATFTPRRRCDLNVYNPLNGDTLLVTSAAFMLRPDQIGGLSAVVIRGRFR